MRVLQRDCGRRTTLFQIANRRRPLRLSVRLVTAFVFLIALLRPPGAYAQCMAPSPMFSPPPETTIPPDAVVWLFVPSWQKDRNIAVTDRTGAPLQFEVL